MKMVSVAIDEILQIFCSADLQIHGKYFNSFTSLFLEFTMYIVLTLSFYEFVCVHCWMFKK